MAPSIKQTSLATRSLTGDHGWEQGSEVAPNISVTTTFRHPSPDKRIGGEWDANNPDHDIYSRYTTPTLTRAEKVLQAVIGFPTLLFPSGIAATFATLIHIRPDVIAITDGYHGCHGAIEVYRQTRGGVRIIKIDDDYALQGSEQTLLCWLETPLNPTGESRDIKQYADKTHAVGGVLAVDSTFGPPPLQDPFLWGADITMHSATKYFAGHSDALLGTLSIRKQDDWKKLWHIRTYTGSNPGSLESWLVLRSLRTLELRVNRQSETATKLAYWLNSLTRSSPGSTLDGPADVVLQVWHSSLQENSRFVGKGKQMTSGPACFGFLLAKESYAEWLGHSLEIFTPATSLGGVESLIEQRFVSDVGADPRLIRVSIGLESFEDLKEDLLRGMRKVVERERGGASRL